MTRGLRGLLALLAVLLLSGAADPSRIPGGSHSEPGLDESEALALVLREPEVRSWLSRYPQDELVSSAQYRESDGRWDVSVLTPTAGRIVAATVDDRSATPETVWVGPQVAWPLARGDGVGGIINRPLLWLAFCTFFLFGLADLRRPLSMRNLDLLALLSLSVHVALLNEARVFAADLAALASFAYLIPRAIWIGTTNRSARGSSTAPTWLLVAGLVFLLGLRVGLNTEESTVLDVGYAGVIGADRLAHGESPYGNFPRDTGQPCGPPNAEGAVSDWIQENGRCETANALGDTYGPVTYHAYLPGLWAFGWSGLWDDLPAVHATTILFDLLAVAGLAAIGRRLGGARVAALLAFGWVANPFTQYPSSSNTNDSIMAALLVWAFWAVTSPAARGGLVALASWTKLAALIIAPLWATYPDARRPRGPVVFAGVFAVTTLVSFWFVMVSADPVGDLRTFYERTFVIQLERTSPFSLWDWGQYDAAGLPDLAWLQRVLQVVLVAAALLVAWVPRRKSPLQLAAFTAALVMGFQLVLTHWSALYAVWFLPFLLLVVVAGDLLRERCEGSPEDDRAARVTEPTPTPSPH